MHFRMIVTSLLFFIIFITKADSVVLRERKARGDGEPTIRGWASKELLSISEE